ncbi:MAG: helix-turn-helix domain containing protein [Dehalococcoidales bacterium]|nr:helix-turn-helix domain containing protein [Dehalococcoidales bacterium]
MEREICGSAEMYLEVGAENSLEAETDLPPEFCHYRDEGCALASSCLDCPFPNCIHDVPGGPQHWVKGKRDAEITRQFNKGKTAKELAQLFGVSVRTVQRALKRAAASQRDKPHGEWI